MNGKRHAGDPGGYEARRPWSGVQRAVAVLALALGAGHAAGLLLGQGPPAAAQFVGSQVCQGCHVEVSAGFRRNPHNRSVVLADQPAERTGCEGCHGPGLLHATSAGQGEIARFPGMAPSEAQERCLDCHEGDFGKMHIRRSAHMTGEVGCTSCHSIHASSDARPLLAGRQSDVCYGCHLEVRARFEMPFKHRVNEGAIECSDCHNPHGSPVATWRVARSPRMVAHAFGNDQPCTGCHTDKRGPFVHEHPPVRVDGCQSCHDPHGSANPRLLTRPTAFTMCMECHSEISGFGVRAEIIPGPSAYFHNLADPVFRECVLCHARIHGSNVDRWFRR